MLRPFVRAPKALLALLSAAQVFVASGALAQDDTEDAPAEAVTGDASGADAKTPAEGTPPVKAESFEGVRVEQREPRAGTPLIQNKLYPMQYRLEFTGVFNISYADKYTKHIGGNASLGFHIFDWLAVEGFGGYVFGDETGIVNNVRLLGASKGIGDEQGRDACAQPTCEPQLPDLWQTTWFAGANLQWAPLYGKLSAVAEYDLNFQLYGILGGGVEGIVQQTNAGTLSEMQIRPSLVYGLGVRLIPWKYVALRLELRNYTGINPDVPEHDDEEQSACSNGYTLVTGGARCVSPDFSNNAWFHVGVSFLL